MNSLLLSKAKFAIEVRNGKAAFYHSFPPVLQTEKKISVCLDYAES